MTENFRGAGLMTLAMAGFALEDMALKTAAQELPVGQILMMFGAFGAVGFAVWVRWRGEPFVSPRFLDPPVLIRAACEAVGWLGHTLALALVPLATVSAILQAAPLVVVAGAAFVFHERVGWQRWAAVVFGFLGVLVILRSGAEGVSLTAAIALVGMAGFAARDLATRAIQGLSNAQIGCLGFLVMVPTGAAILAWTGGAIMPSWRSFALVLAASAIGAGAYAALTGAMRTGEISVVAPFRYARLLFGVALGVLVFGERPDAATLVGSGMILAAGLYAMLRERAKNERRHA